MTKIKSQPQARIERIGKYYTARVGLRQDRSDAQAILADVRNIAPGATIRKALYRTERLIVPDSLDDPAAASTPKPVPQESRQEQVNQNHHLPHSCRRKNRLKRQPHPCRLQLLQDSSTVSNWEASPPKQIPNRRIQLSKICLTLE